MNSPVAFAVGLSLALVPALGRRMFRRGGGQQQVKDKQVKVEVVPQTQSSPQSMAVPKKGPSSIKVSRRLNLVEFGSALRGELPAC